MTTELGSKLHAILDTRVAQHPPVADLRDVLSRGVTRRRRARVTGAVVCLVLGASAVGASQVDFGLRPRKERRLTPASGVEQVGRMTVPRAAHAATLLANGKVLVTGGFSGDTEIYYDTAELFDPATRSFLPTTSMTSPRTGHASVLLDDGTVLIAGGWGSGFRADAEIYDPTAGLFTATDTMATSRDAFTATRLHDGRVLVVGGFRDSYESFNRGAEIFDPERGTFTTTGSLRRARASHTATLLPDGRVVVAGGLGPGGVLRSVEVYDPATGLFVSGSRLTVGRQKHGAVLLDSGKILVVGGSDIRDFEGRKRTAEIYDPSTGTSETVDRMRTVRFKLPSPINLSGSRRVLVVGGADTPELYLERSRSFTVVDGEFAGAQSFPTATLLSDGSVLVTGGYDEQVTATDGAWLFRP